MRAILAALFVLVCCGVAFAGEPLPVGSQCGARDKCTKDAACRDGHCMQVRNIPAGGHCEPALGTTCADGLACCELTCAKPGSGAGCAR